MQLSLLDMVEQNLIYLAIDFINPKFLRIKTPAGGKLLFQFCCKSFDTDLMRLTQFATFT